MINCSKVLRKLKRLKKLDIHSNNLEIVKYPSKDIPFFKVEAFGGLYEGYGEDLPQSLENLYNDCYFQLENKSKRKEF